VDHLVVAKKYIGPLNAQQAVRMIMTAVRFIEASARKNVRKVLRNHGGARGTLVRR